MIPSTVERVPQHTATNVNEHIRRRMESRIGNLAVADRDAVEHRLAELDHEWDIERTLETNAAIASLVGLTLGATVSKRWFIFPAVVGGFLLQHAIQGWCPPVPVFRRLGFRTQSEIEQERYALKTLRGDFTNVVESGRDAAEQAIAAVKR
jgi:Protein of unknown function (DUF2892)